MKLTCSWELPKVPEAECPRKGSHWIRPHHRRPTWALPPQNQSCYHLPQGWISSCEDLHVAPCTWAWCQPTHSTHLGQYIPFILEKEKKTLAGEIVIFHGSTHLGEALVILLRFVTKDWEVAQRLVRLRVMSKSLTSQQLAREVIMSLSSEYHIPGDSLVAGIHVGAVHQLLLKCWLWFVHSGQCSVWFVKINLFWVQCLHSWSNALYVKKRMNKFKILPR